MRPTIKDLRVFGDGDTSPCYPDGCAPEHGHQRKASRLDLLCALGLVIECEECGGRGMVDVFDRKRLVEDEDSCPSCDGLGWQVAPELVELVYQTNLRAGRENAEQLLRQVFEKEEK
jgi:DnaJ-class molecular chaperone